MPRSTRVERAERRRRLLELLEGGFVGSQEEIVGRLAIEGIDVTQATVSRDLDDLGAVRVRRGERTVYTLPDRNGPPTGFGQRVFTDLVTEVAASGNLVVVHTFPGLAQAAGAVIDGAELRGVLGTVAGDDTVLVVADEDTGGRALAERIRDLGRAS